MTLSNQEYQHLYQESINNPEAFWDKEAREAITWHSDWSKTFEGALQEGETAWFVDGKLNAAYNCIDRHLDTQSDKRALIWEGNTPGDVRTLTYAELHQAVSKLANVLLTWGVKPHDTVGIYMPLIPEAYIAMLACARIGAVHSVVFGGFSADALTHRLNDAGCKVLITADGSTRGEKAINFKAVVDEALLSTPKIEQVLVVQHAGLDIAFQPKRDVWYHEAIQEASAVCEPVWMDANDPLFILYTSGSTGKPKGILHATGGYLVYAAMTFKHVFDHKPQDVYWCTADVGWITGHSYGVYGPLLNGATVLIYEGIPTYPTPSRCWEMIDRHQVSIFYTAPTALRSLRREGDDYVTQTSRQSLRVLGSVGEPINPDVWAWYEAVVGNDRCPVVNTWWQTETGGIMLTPLPGTTPPGKGSAGKPFFGIQPDIVDGKLVITKPWPGMMKTVYGDKQRFLDTYLTEVPGAYLTGDLASVDEDGNYWVKGRSDDIIQVSGHRLGTEELESALISHDTVSEAGVVGVHDDIKGEAIYAFVTLKADANADDDLKQALVQHVRKMMGPVATIDRIQWAEALPKTRSGKIMRRLLRKIARHEVSSLGDLSTLAEPEVIEALIQGQKAQSIKEVI